MRTTLRLLGAIPAASILGCTTPQTLTGAEPNKLLATVQVGDEVRATRRDGTTAQFEIETIELGGVLRGFTSAGVAVELPVGDVASLEHRKPAPGKTIALALGLLIGISAATAECESDAEGNPYYDPCN